MENNRQALPLAIVKKIKITQLLDELGVNIIEAGIPIMGIKEQRVIQAMLNLDLKAEIFNMESYA